MCWRWSQLLVSILECGDMIAGAAVDIVAALECSRIGGTGINDVCIPITKRLGVGPV